jgi:pimeloyl-ACP methyl ester carboxylesterase
MAKVAVFIHGMWGTPDVWRNWRPYVEARGWQTMAPALRHHEAPPLAPPADLGTTSLADYVADLTNTIEGLPEKPVVIGHSMGGLLALLLCARGLARAGVLLTPAHPAELGMVAQAASRDACRGAVAYFQHDRSTGRGRASFRLRARFGQGLVRDRPALA